MGNEISLLTSQTLDDMYKGINCDKDTKISNEKLKIVTQLKKNIMKYVYKLKIRNIIIDRNALGFKTAEIKIFEKNRRGISEYIYKSLLDEWKDRIIDHFCPIIEPFSDEWKYSREDEFIQDYNKILEDILVDYKRYIADKYKVFVNIDIDKTKKYNTYIVSWVNK